MPTRGGGRRRGTGSGEEGALAGFEGIAALGAKDEDGETDLAAEQRKVAEEAPGFVVLDREIDGHDGGDALVFVRPAGGRGGEGIVVAQRHDLHRDTELHGAALANSGECGGGTIKTANEEEERGFHGRKG